MNMNVEYTGMEATAYICEQIKAAANRHGKSIRDMAENAGLDANNAYRMLKGNRNVTLSVLQRLAIQVGLNIVAVEVDE